MWPFKRKKVMQWPRERSDAWPVFVNGWIPIRCWTRPDGDERIFLIKRKEGTFMTEHEYFSHDEYENCWIGSGCRSIYDTPASAIREITVMYSWMNEVKPETRDAEPSNAV